MGSSGAHCVPSNLSRPNAVDRSPSRWAAGPSDFDDRIAPPVAAVSAAVHRPVPAGVSSLTGGGGGEYTACAPAGAAGLDRRHDMRATATTCTIATVRSQRRLPVQLPSSSVCSRGRRRLAAPPTALAAGPLVFASGQLGRPEKVSVPGRMGFEPPRGGVAGGVARHLRGRCRQP
jgi:hypothetical protein